MPARLSTRPPAHPELAAIAARQGVTYRQISRQCGVHDNTVSRVVEGVLRPSASLRARIADALGVDERAIFTTERPTR